MWGRVDRVLPAGVAATVTTLLVVFYYPVGSVLVSAVHNGAQFTLVPLVAVLGDPFYTGAAHSLVTAPGTVPGGIIQWVGNGMPPVQFGLFGFTVYQALLSTVASVVVGLPGAYLLARFEFPGRRFVRSVTILPFVLPSIMVAVGFLAMFGRTGLLNDALAVVGLGPLELTFTLEIIILAHAFYNAPLVTRLVTAAWESVDPARIETARMLGASPLRAFRDVTLPQLLPALLTASVLTFIFTFMSFPIVLALGGLELATVEVWLFARVQNLALTEAATLGAIETVNASEVDDPAAEVRAITDGGADVSADALGIATTCQNAVNSLRKGGTHVQIGLTTSEEAGHVELPTDEFVAKEIDFSGSLGLQPSRYSEMLDMIETSKLDPEALVEKTVDIHEVPDELAAMSEYNTLGIPVCTEFSN